MRERLLPALAPSLRQLEVGSSQVFGAIRLVPLLRRKVPGDLRLMRREYAPLGVVRLESRAHYISYVPHGMVATWTDDGTRATRGASLATSDGQRIGDVAHLHHRMAKRQGERQLRFLPLHLSMEGFLSLCFGAPTVGWPEYTNEATQRGISFRREWMVRGRGLSGLEDALRVFEIHDHQVGCMLFVADALASVFVVSHPEDYRELHLSLLDDFYGELLYQYGLLYPAVSALAPTLDASKIASIADLEEAVADMRRQWSSFQAFMAAPLLERPLQAEEVYRCGPFSLQRFHTGFDPKEENHLGEAIVREDGTLEYAHTYRLSAAQVRRAYLLVQLQAHDWNLDDTAAFFKQSKPQFLVRLEKAGFGYLIKPHVLEKARRAPKETM
ncbi:MAG: hypothetical protein AAGA56_02395 [Myxococcota bacterium]